MDIDTEDNANFHVIPPLSTTTPVDVPVDIPAEMAILSLARTFNRQMAPGVTVQGIMGTSTVLGWEVRRLQQVFHFA